MVVEHSGFDLLLGRPWGTANAARMQEAIEGTYLNFMSKGKEYEVNVAPNPRYKQMFSGVGTALRIRVDSDEYAGESESDSDSASEIGWIGKQCSEWDNALAITRVASGDYCTNPTNLVGHCHGGVRPPGFSLGVIGHQGVCCIPQCHQFFAVI